MRSNTALGVLAASAMMTNPAAAEDLIAVAGRETPTSPVDIYVIDGLGGSQQNITPSGGFDVRHLRVSPSGERIAFLAVPDGESFEQLYVINTDGTGLEKLTDWTNRFAELYGWANEREVLYRWAPVPSTGDVRAINVSTGQDSLVLPASAVPGGQRSIDEGCVSPDLGGLVFTAQLGSWSPSGDVYRWPLAGGPVEIVLEDPGDRRIDVAPTWMGNDTVGWLRAATDGVTGVPLDIIKPVNGDLFGGAFSIIPEANNERVKLYRSPYAGVIAAGVNNGTSRAFEVRDLRTGLAQDLWTGDAVFDADWVIPTNDPACSPADFAAPFGTLDIADVVGFLNSFGAGCP